MKEYVVIAGVNGAGKSTMYETLEISKEMERVNTDEIARKIGSWRNTADVVRAGEIAVKTIDTAFINGLSFNQETTLCGHSIINNIRKAKDLGYFIELHYLGVDSVEIAKERIAYRVSHGGHGVPDKDVERRYVESLKNLRIVLPLCDRALLYDNTKSFYTFAVYDHGRRTLLSENVPDWYVKWETD